MTEVQLPDFKIKVYPFVLFVGHIGFQNKLPVVTITINNNWL